MCTYNQSFYIQCSETWCTGKKIYDRACVSCGLFAISDLKFSNFQDFKFSKVIKTIKLIALVLICLNFGNMAYVSQFFHPFLLNRDVGPRTRLHIVHKR